MKATSRKPLLVLHGCLVAAESAWGSRIRPQICTDKTKADILTGLALFTLVLGLNFSPYINCNEVRPSGVPV